MPTPIELFEKLCEAWDVEMLPDKEFSEIRNQLAYKGHLLDVVWSHATFDDLGVFHGIEAQGGLIRALVNQILLAFLKIEERKPTELFEKLCKAWNAEIGPPCQDPETLHFRRIMTYKGQSLAVSWCPESCQDVAAYHGIDAEGEIVRKIVDQLIVALLKVKEDEEIAVAS